MIPEPLTYSAAFIIGLLGSAHCVGMCGGIMGALAMAVPAEKRAPVYLVPILFFYNCGRILSYAVAGALLGAVSGLLTGWFDLAGPVLRSIAGILLVAMGLYIAGWWPGLAYLEDLGKGIWRHIEPLLGGLTPVKGPRQALAIGALWGWIPCGLIYSTLSWAAVSANWQQSGAIMLLFGLGTLPTVLATGLVLEKIKQTLQSRGFRSAAGVMLILFGIWTLPITGLLLNKPHNHNGIPAQEHSNHSQMVH